VPHPMILTRTRAFLILIVLCLVAATLYVTRDMWEGGALIGIAPHQALYQMTMTRLMQTNEIADVRGQMSYRIEDACDGWNVAQKFNLQFVYTDAPTALVTSDYNTYESKDGKRYEFSTRRMRNGQLTDEILGKAERKDAAGNGTIAYQKPKVAEIPLPAEVLFPTQHTLAILRAAQAGQTWFAAPLFDGSDLAKASDVTSFIQTQRKPYIMQVKELVPLKFVPLPDAGDDTTAVPAVVVETLKAPRAMTSDAINASPLLSNTKAWRLRMAFYTRGDAITADDKKDAAAISPEDDPLNSTVPDYEMTMILHSNGVVSSFTLDYPDFSLYARLLSIAEVARNSC